RETARNLDLSLRYHGEAVSGFATVFYNDFRDFIYLGNTGFEVEEVSVLEYRQADARFHGIEFELTLPLANTALGAFSLGLFGDSVRGTLDEGGDVPRLPPWRLGARLNLAQGGFDAFVSLQHAAEQNRAGDFETTSDSYRRLDAGVSYALAL